MKLKKLGEEAVRALFTNDPPFSDGEIVTAIHKMVYGDDIWEGIAQLEGHPTCNKATWLIICELFMEKNRKEKAQHMAGGTWLNYGFSTDESLSNWVVRPCAYTLSEVAHA